MAVIVVRFRQPCDQPSDINDLLELLESHGVTIYNHGQLIYVAHKRFNKCAVIDEVVYDKVRIKRHHVGRDEDGSVVVSYVVEPLCTCECDAE